MVDVSGLQIDIRCIKCGRSPAADVTLYEMQNHLYICHTCRQQVEQSGKQIKWFNGAAAETPRPDSPVTSLLGTRVLTSSLPPNSIFALLNLPITASLGEIETGIAQRMRQLLREEEDSLERTQKIEQLHEWQEKVEDPEKFEEYRNSLKPGRHSGQALSVGGRLVYKIEEFWNACEESREGWADGERYLRSGQLQHWITYQVEDRALAGKIRYYQSLKALSNFRAFNEALYCLVPTRPFRLYSKDVWQPLSSTPSASTPQELARQCDIHWWLGERHLYDGSLCYWLEQSKGVPGIQAYYKAAVAGYAQRGKERGVGLELLLEYALPTLTKPHLVVTFDGTEGEYALHRWDREIPHRNITIKVTNTTRGFTSIDLILEQPPFATEPSWITFNNNKPAHIAGRPGDSTMPATLPISLINLPMLNRGQEYKRSFVLSRAGAYGQPPTIQKFPIILEMMSFLRGLRGRLWLWGLRGGFVGLAWNFAAGALLAFLFYLLFPAMVPLAYFSQAPNTVSFGSCVQMVVIGTIAFLRPLGDPYTLGNKFPLIVGAITGLVGFGVGNGKGHANYSEKLSASQFRTWMFWFSVALVIVLLTLNQGGNAIGQALQRPDSSSVFNACYLGGGGIMIGILTFIIACIVATVRYRSEKYLRERHKDLLNPPGRA